MSLNRIIIIIIDLDHLQCPATTRVSFRCSPLECIPRERLCDGRADCSNGRDEYCGRWMTSPIPGVGVGVGGTPVMAGRTAVTGGTNTVVGDDFTIPGGWGWEGLCDGRADCSNREGRILW